MEIPESMEVIEQGIDDLAKQSDFETFVSAILHAAIFSAFDIMKEPADNQAKAVMLNEVLNTATDKIVLAKENK